MHFAFALCSRYWLCKLLILLETFRLMFAFFRGTKSLTLHPPPHEINNLHP